MHSGMKQGALGASAWLALSLSSVGSAQDVAPAPLERIEEVVVTGIRESLQRNLEMKREAVGVVDIISAEDIGKFPDSNIAASLQRVPGVSIQRAGTRGEPTGITVRGFGGDFNETLYDGRRVSTATGQRAVDFSTVGADFIGALAVMKTPDLSLSASSIGATVNVMFPKPFDQLGQRLAVTASGSQQDEDGHTRPTVGGLFSDTFADDRVGILVNGIYTERSTTSNRVFIPGWQGGRFAACQLGADCAPADLDADHQDIVGWWPQQIGAEQSQVNDSRIDGRIAFQWRPTDNLLLTIDDNYSRQQIVTRTHGFGVWFAQNDLRNLQMDDNRTVVDFTQAGSPMDLLTTYETSVLKTNQAGINLQIDASEQLRFDIDAAYSRSWRNPNGERSDAGDIGFGGDIGAPTGVRLVGSSDRHLPRMTSYGPDGDASRYLDPDLIGSHVLVRRGIQNTDTIRQGRFTATWEQAGLKLDAGASWLQDTFELEERNTFANNFWQAWAGYGAPSGRTSGVPIPSSLYRGTISTGGFIPGFSGGGALPPQLLVYDPRALYAYLEGLGNPQEQNIPGFNYECCDYSGFLDLALDPGSVQNIRERTWAAFVRASFTTELAERPFYFSAGVRQERTDVTSAGLGRVPVRLVQNAADPTLLTTEFSETQPISTRSKYSYLLPSLDMKLELTPSVHARFNASRTLTRPAISFLTPVLNVASTPRVGTLTATGGNPDLKPYLSDNFDLAVEWYYDDNAYAALNLFVKQVSNFIVQGTQRQTINEVIDPTTGAPGIYTVSQRVNGPEATVNGVELAWQHMFGDSGFGFNGNVTLVDTNKPYRRQDISQSGFAVTGLANSANLVGFYDRNGIELRVAANWRDDYLLQFGQAQNNSAFGAEPTFVNSSLQVDVTGTYHWSQSLSVFFEVLNITDDTLSTHGRFDNQLLDVFSYGRRFTLGARYRL